MSKTPKWFEIADAKRYPNSRIEVRIELSEDTHSGYCSDHEELDTVNSIITRYLPDGEWDLESCDWTEESHGHCFCGAMMRYRILSIQRLPSTTTS